MRTPSSRASKWAPSCYVESLGPIPLMASLWIGSGLGWPLKVLDLNSQHIKRGLISKLWMRAFSWHPSNPLNSFFVISTFPAGLCFAHNPSGMCELLQAMCAFAVHATVCTSDFRLIGKYVHFGPTPPLPSTFSYAFGPPPLPPWGRTYFMDQPLCNKQVIDFRTGCFSLTTL